MQERFLIFRTILRRRPEEVADWLSGLLVGRELRGARAWAVRAGIDPSRVRVIGSDALAERYELAMADAGMLAERGIADAAAHGLWRIALRAGIVAARVSA